jgi:ankyrin repeat protein
MNQTNLVIDYTQRGEMKLLKELLSTNPSLSKTVDWSGDSLLAIAAWHGHYSVALMLIDDFDLDVNHRNNQGSTPIHRACCQNHIDIALMLYQKGANTRLQDKVIFSLPLKFIPDLNCGRCSGVKHVLIVEIIKPNKY